MSTDKKPPEEVLKVLASENVIIKEASPGTSADSKTSKKEEKLPKEEVEKRQKVVAEYTRLLSRYCKPHNKKSRWVTEEDLKRVLTDGKDMVTLCSVPVGNYSGGSAIAHTQIDDKDPLRFFVLLKGMVIINPVIFLTTRTTIEKNEGCLSFPEEKVRLGVPRFNRITVIYQTLEKSDNESEPKLSKPITENLNGGMSHMFQHETSHLNGSNIYDDDFKAESCHGFGDGLISEEEAKKLFN
ncbi:MAG: peptide deformylase [Candidatus Paceibacterota bacterium]|jgi:peptide deformylase